MMNWDLEEHSRRCKFLLGPVLDHSFVCVGDVLYVMLRKINIFSLLHIDC